MTKEQNTTEEMDFNEFVNWATGYVVLGIGRGNNLRDLIRTILDEALRKWGH